MPLTLPPTLAVLVPVLAQNNPGPAAAGRVIFWCGVLVLAAALLAVVAWWLRRTLGAADEEEPLPMGFTLADLRTLHARGQLTDEEFEHAKRKMVARTRATMAPVSEADDDPVDLDLDRAVPPASSGRVGDSAAGDGVPPPH